jgi:membrane protein implicated in regulation of membrane protease activity
MAHQNPRSRHPLTWAALTILILAPIVGVLWVPFYARTTPVVADFPFFYWYQLMWVPIVAITSGLAYVLIRVTARSRGGPASAGPTDGKGESTSEGTVPPP